MAEILVLDDVFDAAVLVGKMLTKRGHSVHTFTEEEAALDFFRENAVDLVILDIRLKKMTGLDVLALMKAHAPGVRAIMLTGYPTAETARQAIGLGADEYCVKPIDRDELLEKVAEVLNKGLSDKGEL
ncbi:MAG: response regulator receiver protein [uncultured bacterium]|nr:MAG: response regulator receiver protein [uncultured bacterium]